MRSCRCSSMIVLMQQDIAQVAAIGAGHDLGTRLRVAL